MGRKKWKRLTTRGKDEFKERMFGLQLKFTDIEDNWEKIYDLEECINDNLKTLFECDAICTTCTEEDRAICLLNFRKANVFYLQKIKSYEEFFYDAVQYIGKFITGLHQYFVDGTDPADIELDDDPEEESDNEDDPTMFS
jgi:hypothetical protein